MWLITRFGFFSIVQKPGDDFLTVRTRVRDDLKRLREKFLPSLSPTIKGTGTDYPYRGMVSPENLAEAMRQIALDIDYSNFKNTVHHEQGSVRASRYGKVWAALFDLEKE